MKPLSEACLRNQEPIAEVLAHWLSEARTVLEIGSGTGQHAVFIAEKMPQLEWYPSDLSECLPGIRSWIADADLPNVKAPLALDVCSDHWPTMVFDAIFTANTLHFVGWSVVDAMFKGVVSVLRPGGRFCVYGPFNKDTQFTSIGNQQLDEWLKRRDPSSGIKDIAEVMERAQSYGLIFEQKQQLPANNLLLLFRFMKQGA